MTDFVGGEVEVSVIIPFGYIEKAYRYPQASSEAVYKIMSSFWWRLMVATTYLMFWFIVFVAAIVRFFWVPMNSEAFAYSIFGMGAFLLIITVVIVIVEWSESKDKSIDSNLAERVLNVCFSSAGVSVEMSVGSERFIHVLSIAGIRSVSGYVQDGWFLVRDRGVVIETNDGKQLRFVFSLKKVALNNFLNDFTLSLSEMNFPVRNLRGFQV
ncbi:hypothetical protein [Pseudomonas sp. GL-B-19]|uniref:hypothetical protein n=1 Tax=Pseudomonas sp. GL-B-19 TaxID=2832393 RepID=UPI001CBAA27E|nr:hypothetical protein [Pseudomonas sp. GL-B-19]